MSRHCGAPLVGLVLVATGCAASPADDVGGVVGPSKTTAFPRPSGRSLEELVGRYVAGARLAPVVAVVRPGRIRVAFRVYDRSRRQIGDAAAVLYVARGLDQRARGPYRARFRPLPRTRRHATKATAVTRRHTRWVYVTRVAIRRPGTYVAVAVMRFDNRLIRTTATTLTVIATRHR